MAVEAAAVVVVDMETTDQIHHLHTPAELQTLRLPLHDQTQVQQALQAVCPAGYLEQLQAQQPDTAREPGMQTAKTAIELTRSQRVQALRTGLDDKNQQIMRRRAGEEDPRQAHLAVVDMNRQDLAERLDAR